VLSRSSRVYDREFTRDAYMALGVHEDLAEGRILVDGVVREVGGDPLDVVRGPHPRVGGQRRGRRSRSFLGRGSGRNAEEDDRRGMEQGVAHGRSPTLSFGGGTTCGGWTGRGARGAGRSAPA